LSYAGILVSSYCIHDNRRYGLLDRDRTCSTRTTIAFRASLSLASVHGRRESCRNDAAHRAAGTSQVPLRTSPSKLTTVSQLRTTSSSGRYGRSQASTEHRILRTCHQAS